MTACPHLPLVDRHFAGRIRPVEERELRLHLPGCAVCADRYRRQLVLARLDPAAEPTADRLARGLGLRPRRRLLALPLGLAAIALAAAGLLLLLSGSRPAGYAARGGGTCRVLAYRVVPGAAPVPLDGVIAPADELAFAYEAGCGLGYLAVLAVDEHGHVYWFHPAWTDPAAPPLSIPVLPDGLHELPEAVGHDYDGRELTLMTVFSRLPLQALAVEADLRAGRPLPGQVTSLHLEVRR